MSSRLGYRVRFCLYKIPKRSEDDKGDYLSDEARNTSECIDKSNLHKIIKSITFLKNLKLSYIKNYKQNTNDELLQLLLLSCKDF